MLYKGPNLSFIFIFLESGEMSMNSGSPDDSRLMMRMLAAVVLRSCWKHRMLLGQWLSVWLNRPSGVLLKFTQLTQKPLDASLADLLRVPGSCACHHCLGDGHSAAPETKRNRITPVVQLRIKPSDLGVPQLWQNKSPMPRLYLREKALNHLLTSVNCGSL